jgi:rubredoxin
MWLLFHRNAKTKIVRDGRSFVETCPECGRRARFDEVEVSENVGLFFIDLLSDRERKFRCSACGDVFDLRDSPGEPATLPEPARPAPADDGERERRAAQARRAAAARQAAVERERRERAEQAANRIEDELAELKKRMGR